MSLECRRRFVPPLPFRAVLWLQTSCGLSLTDSRSLVVGACSEVAPGHAPSTAPSTEDVQQSSASAGTDIIMVDWLPTVEDNAKVLATKPQPSFHENTILLRMVTKVSSITTLHRTGSICIMPDFLVRNWCAKAGLKT